jgi:hypothetical protein
MVRSGATGFKTYDIGSAVRKLRLPALEVE